MENTITVTFDSKYRGSFKDLLKEKISLSMQIIFFSFLLLFIGIFIAFKNDHASDFTFYLGVLLFWCFVIGICSSFIVPLFYKKNKGFKGEIRIVLDLKMRLYEIYTTKNHVSFYEKADLLYVGIWKQTVTFGKDGLMPYRFPKNLLDENQIQRLEEFGQTLKDERNNRSKNV